MLMSCEGQVFFSKTAVPIQAAISASDCVSVSSAWLSAGQLFAFT